MNVAIVGCGHIASAYAEGLSTYPNLSLVATADLEKERAESLAAPHEADAFGDVDALLAGSDADLVLNLTIHDAHAPVTRACLEAGRHVVSEKPLALDLETARGLVDLADRNDRVLACAPISGQADAQQYAARLLRTGHIGPVRMAYAVGNFGRTTEWNPNPEPFLRVGPLYDGAVYPLTVLTTIFGPVTEVRTADVSLLLEEHDHDGHTLEVETPDHVAATLEMESGTLVQLTASLYVPHQTQHFSSLEVHGDAGSLYLDDCGNFDGDTDAPLLQVARLGEPYRPCPLPRRPAPLSYAATVAEAARAARSGGTPRASGRQAAHLVAAIEAIEACAEEGASVTVDPVGFSRPDLLPWTRATEPHRTVHPLLPNSADPAAATESPSTLEGPEDDAIDLPPIGFGCSRYRGGTTYVDLDASMADALAAGVRLFDTAELYGTEATLGSLIEGPLGPPREQLFLVGKAWNTNHRPEHLRAAARDSLERLGIDTFDCYMLHWPTAWQHQGPLGDVSHLSHEEAATLTFPSDEAGEPLEADVTLAETWREMEALREDGRTDTLGICNVSRDQLASLLNFAAVPPAVVQVECHPYHHPTELIDLAHARGIRVIAHSPLSVPGLLDDDAIQPIASAHGVSTAQAVLRWNLQHGVVPIPSSTAPDHVHANADVCGFTLSEDEMATIDALHRSDFERP
ncbi:aldo/keto reductase [Salinibacter altiplanensis]|uniref:aldo/keto reductase n=1 Tax=Salinibacter altiplanensis TaxID=1803181 RepID=UPI000C9F9B76|nr:aldo/keto reductase [Salinibacter altiplanensis]